MRRLCAKPYAASHTTPSTIKAIDNANRQVRKGCGRLKYVRSMRWAIFLFVRLSRGTIVLASFRFQLPFRVQFNNAKPSPRGPCPTAKARATRERAEAASREAN